MSTGDLRRAVAQNQFVLHYHPVIQLDTGRVIGVEALVRWQHPQRGLLPPADFIPEAEASGIIVELGEWVLRHAAAQATAWVAAGRLLDVAINLSPIQMSAAGFADRCGSVLGADGVPRERIVLEVTESALLDIVDAADVLTTVRDLGVRVALDDFGTGYSSFTYLRRFPIDIIKIDRSFVGGLGRHADDDAIVSSIVGLARTTGKTLVAEGVETREQLSLLQRLRVQSAQGFLWTPPLPADQVVAWIDGSFPTAASLSSAAPAAPAVPAPGSAEQDRILQLRADGASAHSIAAALNSDGLRTSAGVRWHASSVTRFLINYDRGRGARPTSHAGHGTERV